MTKNPEHRKSLVFEAPKPDMLRGINDLFDLFAKVFKEEKFKAGITRSFISTGCLHILHDDDAVYQFEPYCIHKTCGAMTFSPIGTRNNYVDQTAVDVDQNFKDVEALNAFLDYDSNDENAMNAILNI